MPRAAASRWTSTGPSTESTTYGVPSTLRKPWILVRVAISRLCCAVGAAGACSVSAVGVVVTVAPGGIGGTKNGPGHVGRPGRVREAKLLWDPGPQWPRVAPVEDIACGVGEPRTPGGRT